MEKSAPNTLIHAENITVRRDGRKILHDVSLQIGQRDFITIVGPNGAGKSMLLKCLMGFYAPDHGTVLRQSKLRIGYVPQRLVADRVIPITVGKFLRLRKKVDREIVRQTAEETSTSHLLDKPLSVLSGGELQRVLLARALLDNPELLVLDEPAQNLDLSGQLALYQLLERIYRERNVSILMVSHDLHLVMSCTQQVICLFHHVCCAGAPQTVAKDPEFISLFGADMAKMISVYHHEHNHTHDCGGDAICPTKSDLM